MNFPTLNIPQVDVSKEDLTNAARKAAPFGIVGAVCAAVAGFVGYRRGKVTGIELMAQIANVTNLRLEQAEKQLVTFQQQQPAPVQDGVNVASVEEVIPASPLAVAEVEIVQQVRDEVNTLQQEADARVASVIHQVWPEHASGTAAVIVNEESVTAAVEVTGTAPIETKVAAAAAAVAILDPKVEKQIQAAEGNGARTRTGRTNKKTGTVAAKEKVKANKAKPTS